MTTSSKPIVIGVAGTHGSGKDTVAEYLVDSHGFFFQSTSDLVRAESRKRRGSIERADMHETAEEMRREGGPGVLFRTVYDLFLKSGNTKGLVCSGFRAPGEAQAMKDVGGTLIFVDAPLEIRYERMRRRARDKEAEMTIEQFEALEANEWHKGDLPTDFSLKTVKEMADHTIINDKDLNHFYKEIDRVLSLVQ